MKRLRPIRAILLSLVCCGCSSAPVHYYTLTRTTSAPNETVSAECCAVQIRRIRIPPQVDRPELVTRSGEGQAIVLSNSTWLAPLRDEIQGALTSEINLKLREAAIEPAALVPAPVIFVTVSRFESVPAQYVVVTAIWRIQRADLPKAALLNCEATARVTITSGVSALVQGYQQALVTIADRIALDIPRAGRSTDQRCEMPGNPMT